MTWHSMKYMLAKGNFSTKKKSLDVEVLIPGSMIWSNKTHLVVMRFEFEHYTPQTGAVNKDRD